MNIRDAREKYLKYCKEQLKFTDKSLIGYQGDYEHLEKFMVKNGITDVEQISKKMIREYIDYMQEKYKPRTIKRRIASSKSLFSYLFEQEYIEACPTDGIKARIRIGDDPKVVMDIAEINRILYMAYNDKSKKKTIYHYRDIAILELLLCTGMRNYELGHMKYENWDPLNACFTYKAKGKKTRKIYIENREVLIALNKYIEIAKPLESEYIFLSKFKEPLSTAAIRDIVNRYAKMAGINKKVTPHAFRRTLATMLIEDGMDISYVQRILGHASITTTQEYIRLSENSIRRENASKNPRNKLSFKDYSEFKQAN